jgi:hypothetical protein
MHTTFSRKPSLAVVVGRVLQGLAERALRPHHPPTPT